MMVNIKKINRAGDRESVVNVVKKGLTEKETFQDTPGGSERRNHRVSCRVSIPGV